MSFLYLQRVTLCSAWALATAITTVGAGCALHEQEHAGHYREVEIDELQDEAVAIDLFRFGDNVQAVFRRYDISSATARERPFDPSNEIKCRWTRVADFDDQQRHFSMTIPATARLDSVQIEGQLDGDGSMDVVIDDGQSDEPRQVQMARNSERTPDSECRTIDDFLLRAIFDVDGENHLDPEAHELRNPVFSLLWVGVEPETHDGAIIYVGLNRTGPAIRLAPRGMVDGDENSLTGHLSVSVPPPPEQILEESADTRYALGHFVVIDDSEDKEGSFSWSVDDEPIVGSSLEDHDHLPEDTPEHVNVNGWGQAMFFVEGHLDELADSTRAQLEGIEDAAPDQHFYIVDVFFYNEEVKVIRLPPRPEADQRVQRRVPVQMTERYLEAGDVPVPRLFPYN